MSDSKKDLLGDYEERPDIWASAVRHSCVHGIYVNFLLDKCAEEFSTRSITSKHHHQQLCRYTTKFPTMPGNIK